MFDAKRLLDALIGAAAQIGQPAAPGGQPGQPGRPGGQGAVDLGPQVTQAVQRVTGQSPDQLLQKAKGVIEQNPGLAQAAAIGLAGLLFGSRRKGPRVSGSLAKLGGLAVVGGLAYKAWQNSKAGKPLLGDVVPPQAPAGSAAAPAPQAAPSGAPGATRDTFQALDVPEGSAFHSVSQTEDDALLFLRAMVAAAAADGHIDAAERERITRGLNEAGIDPVATRWLEGQMASPADVEELAAGITTPEKAAQVYAAARIAIDPDTMQEREFLRRLAESLDLDPALRAQIDETASALKV
jgi:uncharacterized membrane protein YebE (DUF533 family)